MPTPPPATQARISDPAAPRVVLVEDDVELREALSENLRLNGMNVLEVASGAGFREAMRMEHVDAAIIDVNLPDASGFELARDLSDDDDRPGLIILTARTGRDDRLQGYAEGADIYMTKPVDNDELVLAVRNLVRRVAETRRKRRPTPETAPAWQLDIARRLLVAPDGTVVVLSGREVMLLELFEKAKGNILSRGYVTSTMGYGSPGPEHRGLDAALRRLRHKVAGRGLELPLLVIHAAGIRFVAPLKIVS